MGPGHSGGPVAEVRAGTSLPRGSTVGPCLSRGEDLLLGTGRALGSAGGGRGGPGQVVDLLAVLYCILHIVLAMEVY